MYNRRELKPLLEDLTDHTLLDRMWAEQIAGIIGASAENMIKGIRKFAITLGEKHERN